MSLFGVVPDAGLVAVLVFPLFVGMVFAVVMTAAALRSSVYAVERHAHHVYVACLAALVAFLATREGVGGLVEPWEPPGRPAWTLPVAAAAFAAGVAIFAWERWAVTATSRLTGRVKLLGTRAFQGASGQSMASAFRPVDFWVVSIVTIVLEETVWRGYLIDWLHRGEGWSSPAAVAVAAAAFASLHYWFGLRNVVLKFVSGLAWGLMFVGSGTVLVPAASHIGFQVGVFNSWRKARSRREDDVADSVRLGL